VDRFPCLDAAVKQHENCLLKVSHCPGTTFGRSEFNDPGTGAASECSCQTAAAASLAAAENDCCQGSAGALLCHSYAERLFCLSMLQLKATCGAVPANFIARTQTICSRTFPGLP
jgi:hypothetical protein